ncbi:WXG100 family type VII secretion target [Nocardia macrotermitis]|uniref:ESAT-6-like protein n=1 Tax=Nocardia macrotermitis TaxID=2585198 RepID=A0A7K0D9N6_9NOCA|nr:WXG100 family type VII secretion target [Nocardia macrotermitis]MQY22480.1 hypothetical protein [Nocardia macrotermitis]
MSTNFMDFDRFQKFANDYAAVIPPINKTIDQLRTSVEAAKKGWQGEAYQAFDHFSSTLESNITQVNKDLGIVSDALAQGEKTVATSDNETSTGFTSLTSTYS